MSQLRRRKPLSAAEKEKTKVIKARGLKFVENPSGKMMLAARRRPYEQRPKFVHAKFKKTEDTSKIDVLKLGLEGAIAGVGTATVAPTLMRKIGADHLARHIAKHTPSVIGLGTAYPIAEKALEEGSYSAAVQAEVARGKAAGLYVEQKIIKHGKLDQLTEVELDEKIAELMREMKIVDAELIEDSPKISSSKAQPTKDYPKKRSKAN